jgi:ribose transport system substrate-binding protein
MKKNLVLILVVSLMVSLFGCTQPAQQSGGTATNVPAPSQSAVASSSDKPAESSSDQKTIAVIPKSLLFDYWQYVRIGAQSAGLDNSYTVDFQGTRTDTDLEGQIKLVEDFIQRKVAAIVISPVNPDGMVPILKEAQETYGIPVIIMDGKLNADFPYSTVSTNDVEAGKFAATKMHELVGDAGGTFAIVSAVAGAVQEGGRAKGFEEQLKTYPNYKVIGTYYGEGDRNKTYGIMQDILVSNPDLTGVYSCNEGSSAGALLGLKEDQNKKHVFVAFDPNTEMHESIRSGLIDGAVAQNPYLIGYTAVENAIKVLKGESVEKKIDVPVTWITKDNIDDPEIQNVLKPKEVIK